MQTYISVIKVVTLKSSVQIRRVKYFTADQSISGILLIPRYYPGKLYSWRPYHLREKLKELGMVSLKKKILSWGMRIVFKCSIGKAFNIEEKFHLFCIALLSRFDFSSIKIKIIEQWVMFPHRDGASFQDCCMVIFRVCVCVFVCMCLNCQRGDPLTFFIWF